MIGGSEIAVEERLRGVVVVEAGEMWSVIRLETVAGVMLSIKINAGRRRIVVGASVPEV